MQTLTVVSLFAASLALTHATPLNIYNQCSESIQLYDNSASETIAAGSSTTRILVSGFNGMFRNGVGSQATLAEFSITGGYIWYDISIIPTGSIGPGNCLSLEACKAITGGTGFNTAMQISPSGCDIVTCMNDGCADAYQFPSDGSKTHSCSDTATIDLIFCPGGSRAAATTAPVATTSSSTTAPIVASTPPITAAPTPAPIPTRSPTIAPTQAPQTRATTPVPSIETPAPTYAPQPVATSSSLFSTAGSCKDSRSPSVSVENTTVPVTPETNPTPVSSARRTLGTDNDQTVSTQSTNSGTAAGTYVVGVVGSLVVVAVIAVAVAVRRKKQQLEAMEPKESVSSYMYSYVGALTPRGDINVMHA